MEDIFRDSIWQFVGAILGFIAIVVTIVIFIVQRAQKKLSYEVVSRETIVSAKDGFSEKIQILYEGQPVNEVDLLILKFVNSGNVPITSNDFEKALSIEFSGQVDVLTAEVTETLPSNLKTEISFEEDIISVAPLLLNSGDTFTIKILLNEFDNVIKVNGRIIGVKAIEKQEKTSPLNNLNYMIGIVSLIISGFFSVRENPSLGLIFLIIGLLFLAVSVKSFKSK